MCGFPSSIGEGNRKAEKCELFPDLDITHKKNIDIIEKI